MSNISNERVVFSNEEKTEGYSIRIKPLNRIKDGIKGASICVKKLQNGDIMAGNLFYQWFSDIEQATNLFHLIHKTIKDNVESFETEKWLFNYHPIRFLIKHRN